MGDWEVVKEEKIPEGWGVQGETPIDRPISTITGQPLMTSEEKLAPIGPTAKEFLREVPPAAGDFLLTMAMPQLKAPGLLAKGANLALRSAGSAFGSAGGEYAAQKMFGEETDPNKIMAEAALGPIGEVGGSALKLGGKGVMKGMSELTATGQATKELIRRNTIKQTADRAVKFIKDLAPEEVKRAGSRIAIDDLGLSIKEAFSEGKVLYNTYGDYIDQMAKRGAGGEPGKVVLDDTQDYLGDLFTSPEFGRWEKFGGSDRRQVRVEKRDRSKIRLFVI